MHELTQYLARSSDVILKTKDQLSTALLDDAIKIIITALKKDLPLLVCGNGGSAADAMHIAGELVARFKLERPGLPVISLVDNPATLTAWSNDYDYESLFARQVEAFGKRGGVLLGISTSGNSKNIIQAFEMAKKYNLKTIALTGESGGKIACLSDILIDVPSSSTPLIQQVHICLYHYLCEKVEEGML